MQPADRIRLRHMLDAVREARGFAHGRTRKDLDEDRQLALSLVKLIEIVGEASLKLSDQARAELPNLPWPDIAGMRHRLIHAYHDIDFDRVWDTVIDDLPPLIEELRTPKGPPAPGGRRFLRATHTLGGRSGGHNLSRRRSKAASIRSTAAAGVSCSQILSTSQPTSRRERFTRASRDLLSQIFCDQNRSFLAGTVPCIGHPCQKQPSIYTASLQRENTMSARDRELFTGFVSTR